MLSNRRRTYLNYLFENMTYLDNIVNSNVGLEILGELNSGNFRSKNILDGHNLNSYNKLMLIFQYQSTSYWKAQNIKITVLNKDEPVVIYTNSEFITMTGVSYSSLKIIFSGDELYVYGEHSSINLSSGSLSIRDLIIIGINE